MEKFRETFYLIYGTCRDGDSVIHGDDQTIVATKGAKKEVRKVFDVVERSENARANTLDRRHFLLAQAATLWKVYFTVCQKMF